MSAVKSALMVIDFQNDIFDGAPAWQAGVVMQRLQRLLAGARAAAVPVIYIQHDEPGSSLQVGTPAWRFPDAIAPAGGDHVSAKQNSSAFHDTTLQAYLAGQGIGRLYVGGYASEFCVDSTVRHGAALGLQMVVVDDAHTTRDRPHLAAPDMWLHEADMALYDAKSAGRNTVTVANPALGRGTATPG